MDELFEAMRTVNNYWWMISALVGLIALVVEMRVKIAAVARKCDHINGKVIEHDRWIHRATGRWGKP